ncbi:HD domain-containing protein [Haloarcula sp. Atlit-120R]|uniref:HD domain-containing protein n=1 Tax=Haloarcula sp. Atlit-120R TaxID=2282135 RepID=UPI000EF2167A|nr:HD domain-containing protein [Haloarcula sp. Atlit-120R]RLM32835.1 HD domain-containing protein [Haloarcula sp. Atlit-120R]
MSRVEFLCQVLDLNDVTRTGWERRGIEKPQRVAGHVWGVSLLTMLFAPEAEGVDPEKARQMAIIHDIAEAKTGDIAVGEVHQEVSISEKVEREEQAIDDLVEIAGEQIPAVEHIPSLWREFEEGETSEANFVRDMDIIEMCLMALKYERQRRYNEEVASDGTYERLDGFFATANNEITTKLGRGLLDEIEIEYKQAKPTE